MKIAGIVAEYNPFHSGHAWHIAETRRLSGCDWVIVCMAGHFTQRGDPAILSKWARARMALACGADAVFELPALFAVRTADAFARGGAAILGGLGADVLSFGSELPDLQVIDALASLAEQEPEAVAAGIRRGLSEGKSHARARGEAVANYLGLAPQLLNRPNLTLAAEYVRAIRALQLSMEPLAVARRGEYHDGALGSFASASAIRAAMERGEEDEALACIPEAARPFARPDAMHAMDDLLLYRLRAMSLQEMAELPDVAEGLEHRLYRLCREVSSREALLEALKCRRYTRARLSRLLTHALLGFDRALLAAHPLPGYARLIGLRAGAEPLLKALKSRSAIPIAASPSELAEDPVFAAECRATDLWALLHDESAARLPGREYTEKFIRFPL